MKKFSVILLLGITIIQSCTQNPPNLSFKSPDEKKPVFQSSFVPIEKRCLNFGPYEKGQSPKDGVELSPEQLTARLEIVKDYASWVRTYGATKGLEAIPGIAKSMGMKVAAGCWLSKNKEANELELASLIAIGKAGQADLLVVGSETLFRNDLLSNDLIDYIHRIRSEVPEIPVTTAEAIDALLVNPEVTQACDLIFCNIYPYWDGHSIDCAMYNFDIKYKALNTIVDDKRIWISESGWPTDGNSVSEAKATLENACTYNRQLLAWSKINDIPVFLFQSFDEAWKTVDEGPQGGHWGIFDEDGHIKQPCMNVLFEKVPEKQIWADCLPK